MNPEQIIAALAEMYASCPTYRDAGRVVTQFLAVEGGPRRLPRVSGRPPERSENSPLTLWVDRRQLLIRRIEIDVRFETFRTETVTEYNPSIGVTIADDELQFGAPSG